jgi:hypothetical protein
MISDLADSRPVSIVLMQGDPKMMRYSCALVMIIAWVAFAFGADTLEGYAQKCDEAIGVTVPDFNCDSGTLVPTTHVANGKCDRPNVLNKECDPGSRFQVLTNNADAYVVAHCRKDGHKESDGLYSDIAVIQHNRKNGATCSTKAQPKAWAILMVVSKLPQRARRRGHG